MPKYQFMKQIRKGLKKFNSIMTMPQSLKSPKTMAAQKVTGYFSNIAVAIICSLIAVWIAQDLLKYNFSVVVVIICALFFLFAMVFQFRGLRVRLSAYIIFTSMFTIIIFEGIALAFLYVTTRPPITYLIVDATVSAEPNFSEIIQNVVWASETQSEKSISGLRVYGGNVNNDLNCDSTAQLIKPIPLIDYRRELNIAFSNLKPQGHASLTIAVLQAVKYDLRNRRGPIMLIVITSGIDEQCEPAQGGIFEAVAQDIKSNTRDDIKIVIISVGNISTSENTVLDKYAAAFNGVHLNASSPNSLSLLITAPQSYFFNYPDRTTPTIIPTQQP